MIKSELLDLIAKQPAFLRALERSDAQSAERSPLAVPRAARGAVLAALARTVLAPMLVLVADNGRARQLAAELVAWGESQDRVRVFPPYRGLFYDRVASDFATSQQRMAMLRNLAFPAALPTVLIVDAHTAMTRLPASPSVDNACIELNVGTHLPISEMVERLLEFGFEPVTTVSAEGEFAHRGGVFDIYASADQGPLRLEYFGDEIESIRSFDPFSQRSTQLLSSATIAQPRELTSALAIQTFHQLRHLSLDELAEEARERWQGDLARLAEGDTTSLVESYTGYVGAFSVLDYLAEDGLLICDEPERISVELARIAGEAQALREELVSARQIPASAPQPYHGPGAVELALAERPGIDLSHEGAELGLEALPTYVGQLDTVLRTFRARARRQGRGERTIIVSRQAERLSATLFDQGLALAIEDENRPLLAGAGVQLVVGALPSGWRLKSERLLLVTDSELFGMRLQPQQTSARRRGGRPLVLAELNSGDFVVHVDHGIGRYCGMREMEVAGATRDFLELEYAAGDRMYVPVDQADRVSRYRGGGEEQPKLQRLGSSEWSRIRQRAKKASEDMADELLTLYAARELDAGHAFPPDTPWQAAIEADFAYEETPDQTSAIADVKRDMESPRPMDRLICGDVGYGKTEVAVRAAFKAVMDGKQVAVLAPTTVLARQHLQTFQERMRAFPVRIEMMSRFRSRKEQLQTLAELQAGSVDIVIGTHRLLQSDVRFSNLGLLIVDEEHRFGVAHKERMKRLRSGVDVLTLSATPIPRTLHMSLAGLRDMSTIATPPADRRSIRTYLSDYRETTVKDAIRREMDRGGQTFFVHNRVQDIERVARQVQVLVPEARIAIAHGQMNEAALEKVMLDFADGKYDVLVCTTIIESGLDLPDANTLIIHEAERFGLAQLYQLRGRIGRSNNRGYAYLMYSPHKRLTEVAERRLRTVFEATELGAGYEIALQDLEIRGAGNLLGAEQHGHIAAVGFDLYCRMLAEAVEQKRGYEPAAAPPQVQLDLPLAAQLPPDYVSDEATRLSLYQRLAAVSTLEGAVTLGEEIRDRFGPMPPEAEQLLFAIRIKMKAGPAGISEIFMDEKTLVVRLLAGLMPRRPRLTSLFGRAVTFTASSIRLNLPALKGDWMTALEQVVEVTAA